MAQVQVNYVETLKLKLKGFNFTEATEEQRKELSTLSVQAIKQELKKALGRGDKKVSNIIYNETVALYRSMGVKKVLEIVTDLETIKGAKSKEDLFYNIKNGLRAGTRGEGQKAVIFNDMF